MKQRNLLGLAIITASLLLGLSCSKSDNSYGNPNPPATGGTSSNTISIIGMTFSPASKTVKKGAVVKWTNNDNVAHTATSNDGVTFDSGRIGAGSSYSYTTDTVGTFNYHCTYHGTQMAGTLVVTQ